MWEAMGKEVFTGPVFRFESFIFVDSFRIVKCIRFLKYCFYWEI